MNLPLNLFLAISSRRYLFRYGREKGLWER